MDVTERSLRTDSSRGWRVATRSRAGRWVGWMVLAGVLVSSTAATRGASRPLGVAGSGKPGFTRMDASRLGIGFTNRLAEAAGAANRVLENGSGVALGDVDGDGRIDVFVCGLDGNSALYLNLGEWRFREATREWGLRLEGEVGRGAVLADLNGDRQLDLLVSTLARGVLCWMNTGQGRFRDATIDAGTGGKPGSTTLALADVDGNGTLDLYVVRYRADDIRDNSNVEARVVGGRTQFHPKYGGRLFVGPSGMLEYGEPDVLYLNDGQGRFREVAWTGGAFLDEDGRPLSGPPRDWGLSASFHDIDGDGRQDLYVCNDYWTPDRLWMNAGHGRFRAAPREMLRQTSENSMGVDFADIDRDGDVDFLVVDMLSRDLRRRRRQSLAQTRMSALPVPSLDRPQVMRNSLYLNRGDGTLAQVASYAGLEASDWSWQPLFLDVDLDGFEDLVISAGHRKDVQDLDATDRIRGLQRPLPGGADPEARQRAFTRDLVEHGRLYPGLEQPVIAFRNGGDRRFTDMTEAWGLDVAAIHQGIASGDLDGDGDLDLVVNRLNDGLAVYRNDGSAPRVAVRLRGAGSNTAGIGAEVRLRGGAVPFQSRQVVAGGRYLSGCDPVVVFAAGVGTGSGDAPGGGGGMEIEVRWPGGRVSRLASVESGRLYDVDESAASEPVVAVADPGGVAASWFEEVSERLNHEHVENPSDDFGRQPLLPRRLSQSGPGVVWFDLNRDGWDDLVIGSGAGGALGVYTNDAQGGFGRVHAPAGEASVVVDTTGMVAFRDGQGRVRWVAGQSNLESVQPVNPALVDRIWGTSRRVALPSWGGSVGPLAMADVDGDGDLDLFIGGQAMAGRYPEAGPSRLLLQEPGGWREDPTQRVVLGGLGWVNGAEWGDLDGDGDPDLVVACEWSPVRVLRNDAGRLVELTREWGLEPLSGWWNGVALGDFDGDGRLDIAASNHGENSGYRAEPARPAVLLYGDFLDRDGAVDLIEAEWDRVRGELVPRHNLSVLAEALPTLRERYPTHGAFSQALAVEVAGGFAGRPFRRLEATTLASTVFLRRDGGYEARRLPAEAQWAPAYAVVVADFDLDGVDDLFLSQNQFALSPDAPRADAGLGLVLRGTGRGEFDSVEPARSGIRVFGEQRGAAASDFDGDGRVDLVVTQNGGVTRLFRNRGVGPEPRPGLRVRWEGPPGNPDGVGVVLRGWREGGERGPAGWGSARSVAAGGGYTSQNGLVTVLARGTADGLRVRWPHRAELRVPIPAGALEVSVDAAGRVTVLRE